MERKLLKSITGKRETESECFSTLTRDNVLVGVSLDFHLVNKHSSKG